MSKPAETSIAIPLIGSHGDRHVTQLRSSYIDQWRGISVLMVLLSHLLSFRLAGSLKLDKGTTLISHIAAKLAWLVDLWAADAGTFGVCIFFVISGYLISSLLLKEQEQTGSISLYAFYVRRVCRIIPALLLYVAAVHMLGEVGAIKLESSDPLTALTFLCNTSVVACGYHFGQIWSLGVEEQFYLIWPLLFLIVSRLRVHMITLVLLISVVASLIPALLVRGWINNGLAFTCISSGVLYATSIRFKAALALFKRVPTLALFVLLCLVLPFMRSRWGGIEPLILLLLPPLICIVVLGREGVVFPWQRGTRVLEAVGLMSYSLYLWHALFVWDRPYYLSAWFAHLSILAAPAAYLSYKYIEIPSITIGREYLARRRAAQQRIESELAQK